MAQSLLNNDVLGRDTKEFTHEERVAYGSKGGKASGAARRRKREMRDTIAAILEMPLKSGKDSKGKKIKTDTEKQIKSLSEVKNRNPDVQTAIILSIAKKAIQGDVVAATFLRDTVGENPIIVSRVEQSSVIDSKVTVMDPIERLALDLYEDDEPNVEVVQDVEVKPGDDA